jgi:glycosyltransferase involved in cell wall biosynthesis
LVAQFDGSHQKKYFLMASFSVVLPVRNGGEHFKQCISGILSQSVTEFNLFVLDNNSSDGSIQWLSTINDPRISVVTASKDLTIEENWARVLELEMNEFITLIGHDDILMPNYLEEMALLIGSHPHASLYQTHFNYIDTNGLLIRSCVAMDATIEADSFLMKMLQSKIDINGTGFMMRSADYKKIGGIPLFKNLLFADFALWQELAGLSYLAVSPRYCFSYRLHQSTTTISSNQSFKTAFFQLLDYLYELKNSNVKYSVIISQHAIGFISKYSLSISHRMLRSNMSERGGFTVAQWVEECQFATDRLLGVNVLSIKDIKGMWLSLLIDSNSFLRHIFIVFKKIYKKPVFR